MRPSSLLGSFLLIVFLTQLEAAKNAEGQIEQCQCDELMNCRKEARENETPCIEKCRRKLNHPTWDKEEGMKCFDHQKENSENHQCMHAIALQTCANEPGVMINKNETLGWGKRHHHHHRKPRSASEVQDNELHDDKNDELEDETRGHEQHRPREHNKRAFHTFIKKQFGKSGQAFVKCMQGCSKHRHHDKCPKELKCGVKKLPQKEFHQKVAECHKQQKPRRYEVCNCLKGAGMSGLDCTFGRNKNNDNETTTQKP